MIDAVNILLIAIGTIAVLVLYMSHSASFSYLIARELQHYFYDLFHFLEHFCNRLLFRTQPDNFPF